MREKIKIEKEPVPRDISQEFLTMDIYDFHNFLRSLRNEPALKIEVDWLGIPGARRLKAFLEQKPSGQKREAAIRATQAEHDQELNVFNSDVKWIKIEK